MHILTKGKGGSQGLCTEARAYVVNVRKGEVDLQVKHSKQRTGWRGHDVRKK